MLFEQMSNVSQALGQVWRKKYDSGTVRGEENAIVKVRGHRYMVECLDLLGTWSDTCGRYGMTKECNLSSPQNCLRR